MHFRQYFWAEHSMGSAPRHDACWNWSSASELWPARLSRAVFPGGCWGGLQERVRGLEVGRTYPAITGSDSFSLWPRVGVSNSLQAGFTKAPGSSLAEVSTLSQAFRVARRANCHGYSYQVPFLLLMKCIFEQIWYLWALVCLHLLYKKRTFIWGNTCIGVRWFLRLKCLLPASNTKLSTSQNKPLNALPLIFVVHNPIEW